MILQAENEMWSKSVGKKLPVLTDAQIENKYQQKSERIVTETNREKLPNFYKSLEKPEYMNTRPFYQRRSRWDAGTQSRLIESILINIPIPPLFVYEIKANVHEVMDGQQRISAIKAFYSNELILEGLERWPEINGKTYSKLPPAIQDGIDRRSISWVSVLQESTDTSEDAMLLKQLVFERINTGGVDLSPQEIRNALYAGPFNNALLELSRLPAHRMAWDLPEYSGTEDVGTPAYLAESTFYKKMEDVEVILRFFALRNAEHYQRGMRGFLDLYMLNSREFSEEDISHLKSIYTNTIETVVEIFGKKSFRAFDLKLKDWGRTPQKAFSDAVMVGVCLNLDRRRELVANSEVIIEKIRSLFELDTAGVLTGRGNTKKDVLARISAISNIFASIK